MDDYIELDAKSLCMLKEMRVWLDEFDDESELLVLGDSWKMLAYKKEVDRVIENKWYYIREINLLNELRNRWVSNSLDIHLSLIM